MNKMAVIFTDTKKNNPRLEVIFYSSRELGEILSKNSLGAYNEAIVCNVLTNPLLSYEVRDSEPAETLSRLDALQSIIKLYLRDRGDWVVDYTGFRGYP